jgi:carnitine 3-dehydrogenase
VRATRLFETVAVVGCGLIGQSWAALFLAHGYDVRAWDPSEEVRAGFAGRVEAITGALATGRDRGVLTIAPTLGGAVDDAGLVQENAPEKVPVKQALYAEVEAAAHNDAIVASSTSSLLWSDLSAGMCHPERLITAHPFNPPHLMPLVEMFGIDEGVLAQADGFYRSLDRIPVQMKKEAVGHIANRLASALWREAVNMVAEGIADVSAIDAALVNGPGLRWSVVGAHMAYHLGGGPGGIRHYLDQLGPSQERRWATLGNPKLTPEVRGCLIEGIEVEACGRSIAQLEFERDEALLRVLAARRKAQP